MKKGNAETPSTPSKEVDTYLATLPKQERAALGQLRRAIRDTAPKATEVISYQIPTFKHYGMLVSFAAWKDHCSFYPASYAVMEAFKDEFKGYDTASTKGTIRFQAGKPLPVALVKKMVKARIKENEARAKR